MKISVSLPDPLLAKAEAATKDLGLSCSNLIQVALEEYLERRKDDEVTRRLNESFAKHPPEDPDPFLQHLAYEAIKRGAWKE